MAVSCFENVDLLIPKLSKNQICRKKTIKKPKNLEWKSGVYVMKQSICYPHTKFWVNPSVFGHKIATRKNCEKYIWQNVWRQFLEVQDHLQK